MRVVVVGAGISGTMTAYFLHRAGCEVTVVERESGAADATSFGNGGVIGCTQVEPWAQPGLPLKLLKWIGREDAPVLVRVGQIPHVMGWGRRFLARCNAADARDALAVNVRLTLYCLEQFAALREREKMTGEEYDLGLNGAYKLFFTPEAFAHAREFGKELAGLGAPVEALDSRAAAEREPALGPIGDHLSGVLAFPKEEIGDCRKFTRWMADRLQRAGVRFLYGTGVSRFRVESGRVRAVDTHKGPLDADAFVVAAASWTPGLLKDIGIRVPVIPVKGVSITVPATPWEGALQSAVIDYSRLFGLIRIGDRLRVSGSAEVTGHNTVPSPARCKALVDSVLEIFPQFAACMKAGPPLYWAGLRGNSPDGVPILGRTPVGNLFLNVGHGPEGWSTSCGGARLVAAAVTGERPEISMAGLEYSRFH
ncbi:MAG: FAD-dependent oxidoreductase [Rhizobiales bacterium]|nr:FAD-dependent oxidoreductase [Hyphomicrobiales bacterium]